MPDQNTNPAPPRRGRPATVPQAGRTSGNSDSRFSLYLIGGLTALILIFGALVYGMRGVAQQNSIPPPTPDFAVSTTPTPPAPDALRSGLPAPEAPITSIITDITRLARGRKLPEAIPQPKIEVEHTYLNLGQVAAGSVVTSEMMIANLGGRELIIQGLATDCACLTAEAGARKLPTGTRTRVLITYNAGAEPAGATGTVGHTLVIRSTAGQEPFIEVAVAAILP